MPRLVWTFLSKSSITSAAGCARVGGKALWITTTTTRVLFPGVPSQLLPPLVQHSIRHHTRHGYPCVNGAYRVRTYTHTHTHWLRLVDSVEVTWLVLPPTGGGAPRQLFAPVRIDSQLALAQDINQQRGRLRRRNKSDRE